MAMISKAKSILNETFGYDEFLPNQEEIIQSVLNKQDTLAVIPTGGGKSLCYQIPSILFEGVTIVISPLISLMKDQTDQLAQTGIKAVFLNSSLDNSTYEYNTNLILKKQVKLLYLAPESIFRDNIKALFKKIDVSLIAVDEAHCISEWGHDFRPDYRSIVKLRKKYPNVPILAMTATATDRVRNDIMNNLKFKKHNQFVASFDRPNLFIDVIEKMNGFIQARELIDKYKNESGIIYCFSRKIVEEVADRLQDEGYKALPYHAGLDDKLRKHNQDAFFKDEVNIIVATVAFGMGINKHDIRYVIHYNLPKSIESYYQEIGRAGRDGLNAHCLLLFSYNDIHNIRYIIDKKESDDQKQIATQHLDSIISFAEYRKCLRIPILRYFGEKYHKEDCEMCCNCTDEEKHTAAQDSQDLTIEAQKFLSTMYRTKQIFGASHIADVLRGSKSEKVLKFYHNELTTYGIGKDFSKQEWFQLSKQLLQEDIIIKTQPHGSLKLTKEAWGILSGKTKFHGLISKPVKEYKTVSNDDKEFDRELFEELRKLRMKLANEASMPAFTIFSDKTLIEMATKFPLNKSEMLSISGIGFTKFEKYGDIFMKTILKFTNSQSAEDNSKSQPAKKRKRHSVKQTGLKKYEAVTNDFINGKSLDEIAEEWGISSRTVTQHIYKYIINVEVINTNEIIDDIHVDNPQLKEALEAFKKLGSEKLKPVYEYLDGKIDYIELGKIRLLYLGK